MPERTRAAGLMSLAAAIALVACRSPPAAVTAARPPVAKPAPPAVWVSIEAQAAKGSQAVLDGHASLVGDRRYELVEEPTAHWSLSHGPLGANPTSKVLPFLDDCRYASIAAFESHLVLSCEPMSDPRVLRLHSTDVDGAHPTELPSLCGEGGYHRLWPASAAGDLVVEGACLGRGDDPFGGSLPPLLRTIDGVVRPLVDHTSDAPAAMVFALRFSPRGDLYALCDDRSGDIFLMVSTDHGATFRRHGLPSITQDGVTYEPRYDHVGTLHAGDDGRVVLVVREIERNRWIRYDSRDFGESLPGRLLEIEPESIDLSGPRGLAYTEGTGGWETNDAGATWHATSAPPTHPETRNDFEKLVACASGGCLVDRALARVGWDLR
jgi:hypothetical protein